MIDTCRHPDCRREVSAQLDKDGVLRWKHTGTGNAMCSGTFAEPERREILRVEA